MKKKLLIGSTALVIPLIAIGIFWSFRDRPVPEIVATVKNDDPSSIPEYHLPTIEPPAFKNNVCNIRDYGAISNDQRAITSALASAIDDCFRKGGGRVIIPRGEWKTGPIHLKSNINIELEEGAVVSFSSDRNDYLPMVFSRFQGMEYYNYSPLIYAKDCENIAITGKGKLVGNGDPWRVWSDTAESGESRKKLLEMSTNNVPVTERIFAHDSAGLRPSYIQFVNSNNILIQGVTIDDGPMWTIHPIYSENIIIDSVTITTHGINTDGIVIDSSKNVVIKNSHLATGDDAIAIKSGLEEDGWRVNRPTENILITNCTVTNGHSGLAIGSEMSGSVRNIVVENNEFVSTKYGIQIKSLRGRGGVVENIWIKNIRMSRVENEAILLTTSYDSRVKKNTESYPEFRNIFLDTIKVNDASWLMEIDSSGADYIHDVIAKNFDATTRNGIKLKNTRNIRVENLALATKSEKGVEMKNSQKIIFHNYSYNKGKERLITAMDDACQEISVDGAAIK
jgi:polygalacturonase